MREWSFGFLHSKPAGSDSPVTDTPVVSEPVAAPPVVVSYERFLERRAWREKIAADFHHAGGTCINIAAIRTEPVNADAIPPHR